MALAPCLPASAPFTAAQRAWLDGYLAGWFSFESGTGGEPPTPAAAETEDFPWHDPTLPLEERLALAEGHRGVYIEQVTAGEAYPSSYTALIKKYRRVIEGTIEYFQTEFPRLLRSPRATWTEKLDVLLTYSSCYVGIVAIVSLIGGVALILSNQMAGFTRLETRLLVLYLIGPFTPVVPLAIKFPRAPVKYGRMFFAAALAYTSLLPMLSVRALVQILKPRPIAFEPTGKIGKQGQQLRDHWLTEGAGVLILSIAMTFRSPALVPAAGLGLMFVLGPALCLSERERGLGSLVRNCGLIPYALMIVLLFLWS